MCSKRKRLYCTSIFLEKLLVVSAVASPTETLPSICSKSRVYFLAYSKTFSSLVVEAPVTILAQNCLELVPDNKYNKCYH